MRRVSDPGELATVDRMVAHRSIVAAISGQPVELFLREKRRSKTRTAGEEPTREPHRAPVLLVHGGYAPAILAFDLPRAPHSWMASLARAGFRTFAMDMTGYGRSPHPMMDDPRNLSANQQAELGLETVRQPSYPFELVNSDSESDDIDSVVEFIRNLCDSPRVSLIGWSGGGCRVGTYASRHPEKIEKLVILASSNYRRNAPAQRPTDLPKPGVPMTIQTRAACERRWLPNLLRPDQIEASMPDLVWALSQQLDPIGTSWGIGGLRAPSRTYWGWGAEAASSISAPTLVLCGEQDSLFASNVSLFQDLGSRAKRFVTIRAATHFVVWEKQAPALHEAAQEWLSSPAAPGSGAFVIDEGGRRSESTTPLA